MFSKPHTHNKTNPKLLSLLTTLAVCLATILSLYQPLLVNAADKDMGSENTDKANGAFDISRVL